MRLFVALGIVLATLIALTVKAMVRRPPHRPPPVEEDEEAATTPAPAPPEAAEPRPFARPAGPPVGPAHIFGRVLPPPGQVLGRGGLTVTADGGRRVVEALTFSDGRFDLHLPPGQYAVVASLGAWVGMAPSVPARSGGEHELTIVLGPTASLRGTVRLAAGVRDATVKTSLAGRDDWSEGDASDDDEGTFEVEGLVPGRTYDLLVEGEGARTATVRSVTAPASDLLVQVDALPVLRGAIGFPSGGECPIGHVGLFAANELPADDNTLNDGLADHTTDVDDGCRFELSVPEGASQLMLLAVGAGWHLEQPISIPPLGDPEPVCLNPPCQPIPTGGETATVTVSLGGAPASGIDATLQANGDEGGMYGCGSNGPSCTFDPIATGRTLTLVVGSTTCAKKTMAISLHPGPNTIEIRCDPLPAALEAADVPVPGATATSE